MAYKVPSTQDAISEALRVDLNNITLGDWETSSAESVRRPYS